MIEPVPAQRKKVNVRDGHQAVLCLPIPGRCFSEQREPPMRAHKYVSVTDKESFLLPILRLCSLQFPKETFSPKFYSLSWVFVMTNEEIGFIAILVTFLVVAQNTQQKQLIEGGFHLGSQFVSIMVGKAWSQEQGTSFLFLCSPFTGVPTCRVDLPTFISSIQKLLCLLGNSRSFQVDSVCWHGHQQESAARTLCCMDGGFIALPYRSCLCYNLSGRVTLGSFPVLSHFFGLLFHMQAVD